MEVRRCLASLYRAQKRVIVITFHHETKQDRQSTPSHRPSLSQVELHVRLRARGSAQLQTSCVKWADQNNDFLRWLESLRNMWLESIIEYESSPGAGPRAGNHAICATLSQPAV